MKFLVDECTGTSVAEWLRAENYEVFSVFDEWRGASDEEILSKSFNEDYILITMDKDFGEIIFRHQKPHKGVILIRCEPNTFQKRITLLKSLLDHHKENLAFNFVVLSNENIRVISQI